MTEDRRKSGCGGEPPHISETQIQLFLLQIKKTPIVRRAFRRLVKQLVPFSYTLLGKHAMPVGETRLAAFQGVLERYLNQKNDRVDAMAGDIKDFTFLEWLVRYVAKEFPEDFLYLTESRREAKPARAIREYFNQPIPSEKVRKTYCSYPLRNTSIKKAEWWMKGYAYEDGINMYAIRIERPKDTVEFELDVGCVRESYTGWLNAPWSNPVVTLQHVKQHKTRIGVFRKMHSGNFHLTLLETDLPFVDARNVGSPMARSYTLQPEENAAIDVLFDNITGEG